MSQLLLSQAKVICKLVHQTVGNILWTLVHSHPPQNIEQANQMIDSCLATANHALVQCPINRSLNITSGALVFHCNMFLNIPIFADLAQLCQH